MDWLIQECNLVHSRQQAVGMWQVLLEEGVLKHGRYRVMLTRCSVGTALCVTQCWYRVMCNAVVLYYYYRVICVTIVTCYVFQFVTNITLKIRISFTGLKRMIADQIRALLVLAGQLPVIRMI